MKYQRIIGIALIVSISGCSSHSVYDCDGTENAAPSVGDQKHQEGTPTNPSEVINPNITENGVPLEPFSDDSIANKQLGDSIVNPAIGNKGGEQQNEQAEGAGPQAIPGGNPEGEPAMDMSAPDSPGEGEGTPGASDDEAAYQEESSQPESFDSIESQPDGEMAGDLGMSHDSGEGAPESQGDEAGYQEEGFQSEGFDPIESQLDGEIGDSLGMGNDSNVITPEAQGAETEYQEEGLHPENSDFIEGQSDQGGSIDQLEGEMGDSFGMDVLPDVGLPDINLDGGVPGDVPMPDLDSVSLPSGGNQGDDGIIGSGEVEVIINDSSTVTVESTISGGQAAPKPVKRWNLMRPPGQ
jgi:hypothetical protein